MKKYLRPPRLLALFTAATLIGTAALSAQPTARPTPSNRGVMRAQEVSRSMRERLPEVARVNNLSSSDVQRMFDHQRDLWVDGDSRLLFVCEGLVNADPSLDAQTATLAEGATAVPNSADAFKLHSLPGAARVIYLDFNGHTTSGTQWNRSKTGGADIVSAPFDMDGNPNAWSTAELDRIKRIWQRVAEDYMPFAVNVTTEDPGLEALRKTTSSDQNFGVRVVISPSSAWYGSAGGVAYVGCFNWNSDTPAFVFSDKLGPNVEKAVAEACAHEAGHTLGLAHDGKTDGTAYYSGHGDWAPIMGGSYYRAVSQWSKGEYAGANNLEDDLAKIPTYGAPLMVDDYGNTPGNAAVLNGTSIEIIGVIENRNDVDVFRFTTGAGTISFNIRGTSPEMNLDVQAELLNASGNVLATSNPAGTAASLSQSVAAGTYYLRIDGVGTGDPSTTGYSDYASIGEYLISGRIIATSANVPPVAAISATPISGTSPLTVNFSSNGSSDPDGNIVTYTWSFGDGTGATGATASRTYSTPGNYNAVLTVTDNSGANATSSVTITVAAPSSAPSWNTVDGNFEAVATGGTGFYAFAYNPTYPGYTFTGNAGIAANGSGFTDRNPAAPSGAQVAFVQMQGSIAFTANFAAGSYKVNAMAANRANYGGIQTVNILVDGSYVGTFSAGNSYAPVSTPTFNLAAGVHTIALVGQSVADATLFIDQLAIVTAGAPTVAIGSSGFESPSVGSQSWNAFQYTPSTISGTQPWTFIGHAGVAGNGSGFTEKNPAAPEGSQAAFVQMADSVIRQTLSFAANGAYTLTLRAANRGNYNSAQQTVQVTLDGAVIGTITPASTTYQSIVIPFSTTQGAHEIAFRGTVSADCTVLIDQLQIQGN